jgi:hypothetical protein
MKKPFYNSYLFFVVVGFAINILYISLLYLHPVAKNNLYPPMGEYAQNVWQRSDVRGYIRPAQTFLEKGVFEKNNVPDYHRTIGYPFFLATVMWLAGEQWVHVVWFLQALLFAFLYPVMFYVAKIVFPGLSKFNHHFFWLYILVGAGVVYSPIFLTDQMANLTLWGALALGLAALVNPRPSLFWLLHLLLLAYAAQVRPTLMFFPLAFWFLAVHLQKSGRAVLPGICGIILIVAIQLIACNGPSIRNYIHHGLWTPSDVMSNNLADYLAKNVLNLHGDLDRYEAARAKWRGLPLEESIKAKKDFAFEIYGEYPFSTVAMLGVNGMINTLETHWVMTLNMFRNTLHSDLRRWFAIPNDLRAFHILWVIVQSILMYFVLLWALSKLSDRKWWLLGFVAVWLIPFVFSATDAQGPRFRLAMEGLFLMMAFDYVVSRNRLQLAQKKV